MQIELITSRRSIWPQWARFLDERGLKDLACWVLEAIGPLTILGSQVLQATAPFLRPMLSSSHIDALSDLLDDPAESRAFTAYLREDGSP